MRPEVVPGGSGGEGGGAGRRARAGGGACPPGSVRDRATRGFGHRLKALAALFGTVMVTAGLALPMVGQSGPAGAASNVTCLAAGSTGLTTKLVAIPGQTIAGQNVNAAGCDVGIYIGPGVNGVTISNVSVTGANDHGIFAEDASGLMIDHSTVDGNGVNPTPGIFDNKAIELVGMTSSVVTGNTVDDNTADGGIGVQDNGPLDSGAPNPGPSTPVRTSGITISSNDVSHNTGGCGIVVAAHNPGGGVSGVVLKNNSIISTPGKFGPTGPEIGGVVVDAPIPHTSISNVSVQGNTITGSLIAGIAVYAGGGPAAAVSTVSLTGNNLSSDGWGEESAGRPRPEAIMVAAYPAPPGAPRATVTGTVVTGNTIVKEYYGVWLAYTTGTVSSPNSITTYPGGTGVYNVAPPGSGYWFAASDGGVYAFGGAKFYGSMGGKHLNAPVVAMAHTIDQGGYWLVASDGGIFSFGDANFFGSMGGKHLNAPVVGIARTPFYDPVPGQQPSPGAEGYWEVASDGGIFSFGDAKFYGSMGGKHLNAPVITLVPSHDGHGYWEVASDGGIFSFGDAKFYGSMGGKHLNARIVGMAATPDGHGYWEVASDGGIFSFGDAKFYGSMGGKHLNARIVGMSSVGVIGSA